MVGKEDWPGLTNAMYIAVLENLSHKNLFPELNQHQLDFCVNENHLVLLIKKIVAHFSKIWMCHLAKKKTEEIIGNRVRSQFTKLIQ